MEIFRRTFEVSIRRKTAYLSRFLLVSFMGFFILFLLFYLFMLPARNQTPEMQLAYINLVLPEILQKGFIFSLMGVLLTGVLFYYSRFYRKADLNFKYNSFNIIGEKIDLIIPFNSIVKIYLVEENRISNFFRQSFKLDFYLRTGKTNRVKLRNTNDVEDLVRMFTSIEGLIFEYSNYAAPLFEEDED